MAGDWYYAQGDQRLGPVSLAELRLFLQSGKIQKGTLVWTDGMQDWAPASEVKAVSGSDSPENLRVPMGPPAKPGLAEPSATPPPAPSAPELPAIPAAPQDLGRTLRMAAWPLVVVGLLLVVAGQGCEMLSARHASYINARTKYLPKYYAEMRRQANDSATKNKDAIQALANLEPAEKARRIEEEDKALKTRIDDYNKAENDYLQSHNQVVLNFESNDASWSYYRSILIILGTAIVIVGLVSAYVGSESADRWVAIVLLAVLIYAIFVTHTLK